MPQEDAVSDIASLLENVRSQNEAVKGDLHSSNEAIYKYIKDGLVPNLQGLCREIQAKIEAASNQESTERFTILDLKEERFVSAIRLLTHPEIANRLKLIQESINDDPKSPILLGLIAVGSSAFGGLLIREALGEADGPWVDADLISSYILKDGFNDKDAKEYLQTKAKPELAKLFNSGMMKTTGSRNYNLCDAHNIGTMNFAVVQSEDMATSFIDLVAEGKASTSIIYEQFFPSYPPNLSDIGRNYILTALAKLAQKDHDKWEVIVAAISTELKRDVKFLKPKHFGKLETGEITEKLEKFNDFIASLLIDLIKETENTNK